MAKSTPPCEILEMSKDCVHIAPRGKSSAGNILPSNNRIWPGKNSSNSAILPHEAKWQHIFFYGRNWIRSDWWFSKNVPLSTGSDSILSDQNWTRPEKCHCPLMSEWRHYLNGHVTSGSFRTCTAEMSTDKAWMGLKPILAESGPVLTLLFFLTRSVVFLFYLGFCLSGFFWLWSNFRNNVCCIKKNIDNNIV